MICADLIETLVTVLFLLGSNQFGLITGWRLEHDCNY